MRRDFLQEQPAGQVFGLPREFRRGRVGTLARRSRSRRLREDQRASARHGELADGVHEAWDATLRQALETEPARMLARLQPPAVPDAGSQSSALQQDLFASLRALTHSKRKTSDDLVTVHLLRHVRLLHFNFESPTSGAPDEPSRLPATPRLRRCIAAAQLWRNSLDMRPPSERPAAPLTARNFLARLKGGSCWPLTRTRWPRFEGVLTLGEWESQDRTGFAVPWVDFAARSQIVEQVRARPSRPR